jgi:hypothetical protein
MNEKPCHTKMSPCNALNNPTACGVERELKILYAHNTKFLATLIEGIFNARVFTASIILHQPLYIRSCVKDWLFVAVLSRSK